MRPFVLACAASMAVLALQPFVFAQEWLRQAIPPEARSVDFGTVARAAKTEHRFVITNHSPNDIHLVSARASCGCTTPIIETEWIKAGQSGTVLARFNTGTFTGRKSATLTISIDRPHFAELQLNVRGYIRSDVVLNPGEVNFGEVPVGEPKTVDLTLDYAGRSDWKLVGLDNPLDFVDTRFEEVSRNGGRVSYKISATLTDAAAIGSLQNQLMLKTNDRNLTSVPIRVLGSVLAPIQVSPQLLVFGEIHPQKPVSQRLVIKGRSEFRILDIRASKAEITFEAPEAAKMAHLLNINIVPIAQPNDGEVTDEIKLFTDLMDEPIVIPLRYKQASHSAAINVVAN